MQLIIIDVKYGSILNGTSIAVHVIFCDQCLFLPLSRPVSKSRDIVLSTVQSLQFFC